MKICCYLTVLWVFAGIYLSAAPMPPWSPGCLDIHHIAVGCGNSTLVVAPDGSTLLIDAGAAKPDKELAMQSPVRPDPHERVEANLLAYITRHLSMAGRESLDFAIITHFHPDHSGSGDVTNPASTRGNYRLSGISDVGAHIPIGTLIDRGFPDYDYPSTSNLPWVENYKRFVKQRILEGGRVEAALVGCATQIKNRPTLDRPYPRWEARIVSANGDVWTGHAEETQQLFPPLESLAKEDFPDENICSLALTLRYGNFSYLTSGDLTHTTRYGKQPWRDVESAVARAVGKVDVTTANHHGFYDAVGVDFLKCTQPQVIVVESWHISHPNISTLDRMFSEDIYPEKRAVFVTNMAPISEMLNWIYTPKMSSMRGNVIIRVEPKGDQFWVYVTDPDSNSDEIMLSAGPYRSSIHKNDN